MKRRLAQITNVDFVVKGQLLSQHIADFFRAQGVSSHDIIGVFAPLADEAKWFSNLEQYANQFAFPGIDNGKMIFLQSHLKDLQESREFGVKIKVPAKECKRVIPDIVLVPGLAFNAQGERLGRGKGFYDRYLKQYQGLKIGICLKEQLIDSIPTEQHDVKMDLIITDDGILTRR